MTESGHRTKLRISEPAQLALLPTEPAPLRPRQQAVLDALTRAGHEGLTTDEAGAVAHSLKEGRWAHNPDARCKFCLDDGHSILNALKAKGLARYRRANRARGIPGAWVTVDSTPALSHPAGMLREDEELPY